MIDLDSLNSLKDEKKNFIDEIFKDLSFKQDSTFLPTPLRNLNNIIDGLPLGHVTIVAGRPSSGKTALSCNFLLKYLQMEKKCFFFSIETSGRYLLYRMISIKTGLNYKKILSLNLNENQMEILKDNLSLMSKWIEENRLKINDQEVNINNIEYLIERQKRIHDLDVIIIDYLQIMRVDTNKPPYLEYANLVNRLKSIAKRHNLIVVLLSQLSRGVENRNDLPKMSDLSYSGGIEAASDLIIMIHRNKVETQNQLSFPGEVELMIAKNRNGKTGISKQWFDPALGLFEDKNDF